jgi:hypothetical protein
MRRSRPCGAVLATLLLLAFPAVLFAQGPPACIAGTSQSFSATGALQTYSVPAGTTALLITANGGSGGSGVAGDGGSIAGGLGAHLVAGVPVSAIATLDVVVGSGGGNGEGFAPGGGGGGGSLVFTPGGTLLVAAGAGGGGSFQFFGGAAQLGTNGAPGGSGGSLDGAGGTAGSGGGGGVQVEGGNGSGGGGFLGDGADGVAPNSGFGGHRISPPGTAAGGAAFPGAGAGGFGGGGGAGDATGAGGGGYSGGGGGSGATFINFTYDSGGGGGSFVAAGGTTYAASLLGSPGDGSVAICATAIFATPTLTAQASPTVPAGGSISDLATLAGGFNPAGTITFRLFGPSDPTCAAAPIFTSMPAVSGNGTYPSGSFVASAPGTYRWEASYSGDSENAAAGPTVCSDPAEAVVVSGFTAAIPTLSSWGLIAMTLLLLTAGIVLFHKRRAMNQS